MIADLEEWMCWMVGIDMERAGCAVAFVLHEGSKRPYLLL